VDGDVRSFGEMANGMCRTSAQQVVDFVKAAQGTAESVDGSAAVGGTAGKIALDAAG
jgi:hypothetical protein